MITIKALLTGLVGTSLCMANIIGIVTDTGTTPIAGVVVQLEKEGQTATTGADGSFTIVVKNNGSGFRSIDGRFLYQSSNVFWWSSTDFGTSGAANRHLSFD